MSSKMIQIIFYGLILWSYSVVLLGEEFTCEPKSIGPGIATKLNGTWNKGSAKSWGVEGEFWSMPFASKPKDLAAVIGQVAAKDCEVVIADLGGFSARILPKVKDQRLKELQSVSSMDDYRGSFISPQGTTIGILSPHQDEYVLIMYSAKIASALARGSGIVKGRLANVLAGLSGEIDIEYNFNDVLVSSVSAVGQDTMSKAASNAFREIKSLGYAVMPKSESSVKSFDGWIIPDRHESFWTNRDGILRVEIEKLKQGKVRVTVHETRQQRK